MCTSHFQLRDPLFAIHINFTLKCLLCLHWSSHFVVPWSFLKISLCLPSCFHFVLPWSFWKVSLCLPWSFHFVLLWSFLNVSVCLHWSFHLFFFFFYLEVSWKFRFVYIEVFTFFFYLEVSWKFRFVYIEVFTFFFTLKFLESFALFILKFSLCFVYSSFYNVDEHSVGRQMPICDCLFPHQVVFVSSFIVFPYRSWVPLACFTSSVVLKAVANKLNMCCL